jgi:hypothetical protein
MLFLTLFIFELIIGQASSTALCNYYYSNDPASTIICCDDFNSWSEMNEASNKLSINYTNDNMIFLTPSAPIKLTSQLNLSSFSNFTMTTVSFVSGLDVYPWPTLNEHGPGLKNKMLIIYFSAIEFYVNNTRSDAYTCSPGLIPDDSSKSVSFFSKYLEQIYFNYGNTYGTQAVCPFVFKNAQLDEFILRYQVDSFLFVSLFRFQEVNLTTTLSINSAIANFYLLNGYNFKLDKGLLHSLVFENVASVFISGMIRSIQTDLFKHFELLNDIEMDINNLGFFYHKTGIEWMNYLNINSTVSLYNVQFVYSYPDRDFCIFSQFPVNRSITLNLEKNLVSTFTNAWLCKAGNMNMGSFPCNQTINWTIINGMLNLCKIKRNETDQKSSEKNNPSYTDFYQIRLIGILFVEIIPFILIPCVCFIGLFFNWKIIQTINKHKKKDLKEDFYKYMSANAKFNCLYCLIFVFYPMTSCIWRLDTTFCSSVFTYLFVQYYKIVVMAFFGEVAKMCANISYIMMTLNRYLLVGKDHAHWLVTLAKLEFKWVIRVSILFSVLINIGHGWQYQAVEQNIKFSEFAVDFRFYNYLNGNSYSDYPSANQETSYFIYSIVYFCINFGVFFILNTGMEVNIVRHMHKELKEKRKRLAKMNFYKSAVQTGSVGTETKLKTDLEDKKREEEDNEKKRMVIIMVILNGILNFILRAPEMFFWIENYKSWQVLFGTDVNFSFPGFLNLLADVSYLAYILTFSSNFYIFYKFNKNFKEAVVFFRTKNQNENSKKIIQRGKAIT